MKEAVKFDLVADRRGMVWDLLLYVPTVVALGSISASLWYGNEHNTSYLLFFLTCFFFIAGFNRVFKTRLMLLPSAPVALMVGEQGVGLIQKNGVRIDLVKNLRYFPDYAGKSFGLSGQDGSGKLLQFVFHKGQFPDEDRFASARDAFKKQCQPK